MIKLIEEDADSFARRAEMYYKKRPELMKLVEASFCKSSESRNAQEKWIVSGVCGSVSMEETTGESSAGAGGP